MALLTEGVFLKIREPDCHNRHPFGIRIQFKKLNLIGNQDQSRFDHPPFGD
jgi:hypothetical protein